MKKSRLGIATIVLLAVVATAAAVVVFSKHQSRSQACTPDKVGEASAATLQASADQLVPPPSGETGNVTAVTDTSATLNGNATPNGEDTQVYFQYGPTTDYGTKTTPVDIGSNGGSAPASAGISSLERSTGYHYQEIIETPTHLLYGSDETFTTHASSSTPPGSTPQPVPVPAIEPEAASPTCR
jgi:hypothetical protein